MKKILFLIAAIILAACSAPPQVTVTSAPKECCAKVTVTLTPPSTEIPAPVLTETPAPTAAPTAETVTIPAEQLATMSDEQKLDVAPSVDVLQQDGQISADIDPTQIKVQVEAGHIVTYTYNGEHVAVNNLLTGETHDQMGYKEYGDGQYLRVFWDNDWEYKGYTPELDKHQDLTDKLVREWEAIMATNYYNRNIGIPAKVLKGTTAEKMNFLEHTILPEWNERIANGTLFADGNKIPFDKGVLIDGQIPDINVKFEYNPENSTYFEPTINKETYNLRKHPWVSQAYDAEANVIQFTIGMDAKLARMQNKTLVGGWVLGNLAFMTMDNLEVVSGSNGDMRGTSILWALDVPNLGSDFFSERVNGNLRPDISIAWFFDGLEDKYYNQ